MATFTVEKSVEAITEGSTSSTDDEEWKDESDHSNEDKSNDETYEQINDGFNLEKFDDDTIILRSVEPASSFDIESDARSTSRSPTMRRSMSTRLYQFLQELKAKAVVKAKQLSQRFSWGCGKSFIFVSEWQHPRIRYGSTPLPSHSLHNTVTIALQHRRRTLPSPSHSSPPSLLYSWPGLRGFIEGYLFLSFHHTHKGSLDIKRV
ncbi:hypothetical protein NE237_013439 [Protea cynaroides]|uniref:Uncharacterized protein n=1 Tax=Protea cynaroides TaxID=273540 RepID=A0A9Q0JYH7_9MAGN|nr:hypothetical protein NE237_013439 [Protea cynaroides]